MSNVDSTYQTHSLLTKVDSAIATSVPSGTIFASYNEVEIITSTATTQASHPIERYGVYRNGATLKICLSVSLSGMVWQLSLSAMLQ
jgi:hypothetical protein